MLDLNFFQVCSFHLYLAHLYISLRVTIIWYVWFRIFIKKFYDSYSFFIVLVWTVVNCEWGNTCNLVCHGLWQETTKIVDKPMSNFLDTVVEEKKEKQILL
jgi:hypothetical protein